MFNIRQLRDLISKKPEFNERLIQPDERDLFQKAIKLYFFLHHLSHDQLPQKWSERFHFSSNVIYSAIRGYMLNGQFDLEYLEYLNHELAELQANKNEYSWSIPPDQIDYIELQPRVPLTFNDEETGETLELIYYPDEHRADYRIY